MFVFSDDLFVFNLRGISSNSLGVGAFKEKEEGGGGLDWTDW